MAIVVECYARSGGTLLNKCLGALPGTVVLSEVNPLGGGWGAAGAASYTTVSMQAKQWYGIDVETEDFINGIVKLDSLCKSSGRHLVVRDWCYVNFASHEYNHGKPPKRFLTIEGLRGKVDVKIFAFVRDAIDIWISRGCPDVKQFFEEYWGYIEKLTELKVPVFKYEDFCANPMRTLREICECVGLDYADVSESYRSFDYVNGDTQGASRGNTLSEIKLLPRKDIQKRMVKEVNASDFMKKCNSAMGYRERY
jgi:hypothetical protein